MATITSASAVLLLGIESVFPTAQQIQDFGVDDAFTVDAVAAGEAQVGVDGQGVGGYIPRSPRMTIRLLASSRSVAVFEQWIRAMDALQDTLYANMVLTMRSVNLKYTAPRGQLMEISTLASARRVLENREFHIQWLPQGFGLPAISASPT